MNEAMLEGDPLALGREEAAARLLAFLEDCTDAPDALWAACLGMVERALAQAREASWGRFSNNPAGELRRLEERIGEGLQLAGLAVAMSEAHRERWRPLDLELHAVATAAGQSARRAQTVPAEVARRANAEQRRRARAGLPVLPELDDPAWRERACAALLAGRPLPEPLA